MGNPDKQLNTKFLMYGAEFLLNGLWLGGNIVSPAEKISFYLIYIFIERIINIRRLFK